MDTVSRPARRLSAARNERYVEETTLQARSARVAKRLVSTASPRLSQPNTWSALLLAALIVAIVAQSPIARLIGTAPRHAAISSAAAPAAHPSAASSTGTTTVPNSSGRVITHAPRDPFRPLIASDGSVLAPRVIHVGRHHSAAGAPHSGSKHATGAGANACRPVHTVVAGDSLWAIAQAEVGTSGRSVAATWRALLAANQATIGSNPDLLRVGEKLCLPSPAAARKLAGSTRTASADVMPSPVIPATVTTAKVVATPAPHRSGKPAVSGGRHTPATPAGRTGRFGATARPTLTPPDLVGSSYDATESSAAARRSARSGRRNRGMDHHLRRAGGLLPA